MKSSNYFRKIFYLSAGLFLFTVILPLSWGKTNFFPFEKIKPGMTGFGYTVFSGTKIEKFEVKVIAVVEGSLEQGKLLLVRLSGKELEAGGGLAAGMSGSPVYLDGMLAGAISYGFENADPFLALVTPISSMLKLFNNGEKLTPLGYVALKPVPVVTPVMVTGMGRRGFDLLKDTLGQYGLKTVYPLAVSAKNAKTGEETYLKPGSAIAVQMVSGDFQVSAIGTVTFVDHKNFLAFGHSFTNKGSVDFPAAGAYIFHTVKSNVMSFKLGTGLNLIGKIIQDRPAGLLGKVGETLELIPVFVHVTDLDRNQSRESRFQVIGNEQMYRDFIISGVTDTIDQAIDRIGSGTAAVTVRLQTGENPEPIVKENLFYDKDIAVSCLKDLQEALDIFATNDFCVVTIKSVQIEIKVHNKQESARIQKLDSEKTTAKPGDSIQVNARVHSFRGNNFDVPFTVKLPDEIQPGKLTMTVRGGSKGSFGEEAGTQKKENSGTENNNVSSYTEQLENYLSAPRNNELVLEFMAPSESKSTNANPKEVKDPKPIQLKSSTKYVIFGEAQLTIEIEKQEP